MSSVPIGQLPPLGEVPRTMPAMVLRSDRLGDPLSAFQVEEVEVPRPEPHEVLVAVMAAGINYNNVWAATGTPVDVIASRRAAGDTTGFHIGGSDASGIVYAVGSAVTRVKVGDEVVTHPGWWLPDDPWIARGGDPMIAGSARIYGYDTNFGSFGQFTLVQEHQCMPKADHLSWEEAAASTLVGTTAYRMLHGWAGNTVRAGDVVLVWGGSGGLGSMAIQLARLAGARPVAVVSDPDRGAYCERLGAVGWIDRREFDHWGVEPHWTDAAGQKKWTSGVRAFGKRLWEAVGERRNPAIVFEHPGEDTIPTSVFVCEPGGMVVICAGTTGYSAMVDLRYLWVRQKRLQGSHGTNDEQAYAYNGLVRSGALDPCLGRTLPFDQLPRAHRDMLDNKTVYGNTAVLVGAPEPGLGRERVDGRQPCGIRTA
ncbi:crotonyl-CoA carboxylase/reductase [Phytohabitans suffuscus]|uniref:Crotonyl-CoA carboxylase/reductase n=1 Tax=Phytohabitans suffuscus TaxID=624315 RepID=A0A6F8YVE0_9ACTN|nr:crotonyl-CoA carboxylase/reductase [Phytohabitans suffuscus]BCB90039.1 crotonyl-CoA carboxylase/reductase [Phytohabitans suffuscus]